MGILPTSRYRKTDILGFSITQSWSRVTIVRFELNFPYNKHEVKSDKNLVRSIRLWYKIDKHKLL